MLGVIAIGNARASCASAVAIDGCLGGGDTFFIKGQAEIIIGADHDDFFAINNPARGRENLVKLNANRTAPDLERLGQALKIGVKF